MHQISAANRHKRSLTLMHLYPVRYKLLLRHSVRVLCFHCMKACSINLYGICTQCQVPYQAHQNSKHGCRRSSRSRSQDGGSMMESGRSNFSRPSHITTNHNRPHTCTTAQLHNHFHCRIADCRRHGRTTKTTSKNPHRGRIHLYTNSHHRP